MKNKRIIQSIMAFLGLIGLGKNAFSEAMAHSDVEVVSYKISISRLYRNGLSENEVEQVQETVFRIENEQSWKRADLMLELLDDPRVADAIVEMNSPDPTYVTVTD